MTGAVMNVITQVCAEQFLLFVGYLHFPVISQLPNLCLEHIRPLHLSLSLSLSLGQFPKSNVCRFSLEGIVKDEKQPKKKHLLSFQYFIDMFEHDNRKVSQHVLKHNINSEIKQNNKYSHI